MLIPWLNSACNLVRLDVCSPEEINNCWVVNTGSAKGPIELIDQVGLDLFHHVCVASGDPIALENANFLKKNYIDKGFLGEKSGRGILVGAHKQLEKNSISKKKSSVLSEDFYYYIKQTGQLYHL